MADEGGFFVEVFFTPGRGFDGAFEELAEDSGDVGCGNGIAPDLGRLRDGNVKRDAIAVDFAVG